MARLFFDIKIDPGQVEALAAKLGQINPERLGVELVKTLNEVANDTYTLSRKEITRGINLDQGYVDEKIRLEKASASDPRASIVADAKNSWMTNLSHYGAMLRTQAVKHPARAKGDPGRGISRGQKMRSMDAEVVRGGRKSIGKKFILPGINDSRGNPIVFRGTGRPGTPKSPQDKGTRNTPRQGVQAVLGPSVYQLFRVTAENIQDRVSDDLERAIVETAEREFLKALR